MEIDTTLLFNSPAKVSKTVNSVGGVIEFDPGFSYAGQHSLLLACCCKASVQTLIPLIIGTIRHLFIWQTVTPGSNQSHYYQHLYSDTQNIKLDSARKWTFSTVNNYINANFGAYPTAIPQVLKLL